MKSNAEKSVEVVRNFFKSLGYKTTEKSSVFRNGYDLVILKGNKSFSIEVKTAFLSSRSWKNNKEPGSNIEFETIHFVISIT